MKTREFISRQWNRRGIVACLLWPFALVFSFLVFLRRAMYRRGWLSCVHLPVPVVVVGNIVAGGSGKTPLTLYLAQALMRSGRRPGILSRGYGGSLAGIEEVVPGSDPSRVGDEPLLLALRAGCPVFVGKDRVAAARQLLATYPRCDVLISDDGLQHLRMARDIEIIVMDGRGVGNGWLMPAGPLREPVSRIAQADALVLNTEAVRSQPYPAKVSFRMTLLARHFYNLADTQRMCEAGDLQGKPLFALAGIGEPARFFRQLENLGLQVQARAFPDHHRYQAADFAFARGGALLMTEKDAVKCRSFALPDAWVLPVDAALDPELAQWVLEKLDGSASA